MSLHAEWVQSDINVVCSKHDNYRCVKENSPGWGHAWFLEQGLLHSGGGVPQGTGGYKTVAPQWHDSSSKPAQKN